MLAIQNQFSMFKKGTSQAKQKCICEQYFAVQENMSPEEHSTLILRYLQEFCLCAAETGGTLKLFATKVLLSIPASQSHCLHTTKWCVGLELCPGWIATNYMGMLECLWALTAAFRDKCHSTTCHGTWA